MTAAVPQQMDAMRTEAGSASAAMNAEVTHAAAQRVHSLVALPLSMLCLLKEKGPTGRVGPVGKNEK